MHGTLFKSYELHIKTKKVEKQNPQKMETFQKSVQKIAAYIYIIAALVSGFYIGSQYHRLESKPEFKPTVKKGRETSIAINEANQLMLIDRKTGKYEIYSDSIGISIFRMYASKIYQNKTSN